MELFYWKSPMGNFGDDLNPWLWPKLFPGAFRDGDEPLFVGIGSILDGRIPRERRKIVFGAGVRQRETAPILDANWDVRFVRGPNSAQALGLSPECAITDSALCLRLVDALDGGSAAEASAASVDSEFGFMPHMSSWRLPWAEVCSEAGFRYIDPKDSVPSVIAQIRACGMLLTEAMHGAIVADAFRVPWHQVRCHNRRGEGPVAAFKWKDWRDSLGVKTCWSNLPIVPRQFLGTVLAPPLITWLRAKLRQLRHPRYYGLSTESNLMNAIERLDREIARLRQEQS